MTISFLKSLFFIIVLVYFGLGALLYFFQHHFIYFPSFEINDDSEQSIKIQSDGETLNVWVINPGNKEAIIFFGGNAANAYYAIGQFKRMITDRTVYLVDYRGYGGSSGSPSEQALFSDALNIYDHLKTSHDKILVFGQSLGSSVAIHMAAHRDIQKMILTTPFDSIVAVAKSSYPIYPVSILLKERFDSLSLVDSITAKTLMIIAEKDRIIPKKHAYSLAKAFKPEQLKIVEIANTGHNTVADHPQYEPTIIDFLH